MIILGDYLKETRDLFQSEEVKIKILKFNAPKILEKKRSTTYANGISI